MSSSVHFDNKKKYILILSEVPTQVLDDTTLTAQKMYPINFTESRKKFVYAYIIMEQIVIYSLMVLKFINSKQKTLKLRQFYYFYETFQNTFL